MELQIQAKLRAVSGKQNKKLRRQGRLPAVLYGPKKKSLNLEVDEREFGLIYRQAGENTLVDLVVEGQPPTKVLIHEVASHFMKDQPIHVDFYEVDLTKKIHAHIPLRFVGEALAVKEQSGVLVKNISEVEVEALPTDLPHEIGVDISSLKTFEDVIRLADVKVSDKVKLLGHTEDVVALVQPPRTEEELAELEKPTAEEEAAAVEEVAGEEEEGEAKEGEKKEEAEGEETEKSEKEDREEKDK